MFFIMGMNPHQKQISYNSQLIICSECGKYGRYEVWMTCMCFTFFFIPLIKWNKQYFVKTTCCETIYELDSAIGKALAKGADIEIRSDHLKKVANGHGSYGPEKTCGYCGYKTNEDFQYCPKCGRPF